MLTRTLAAAPPGGCELLGEGEGDAAPADTLEEMVLATSMLLLSLVVR